MSLTRDIRLALRGFLKDPGFAAVTITTLALGIGASTLMFSIVDNTVLNPFPYADADRLMTIQIQDLSRPRPGGRNGFTAPEFLDYAERNHVFDQTVGRSYEDILYSTESGTEQFAGTVVTPNTFEFLGMQALIGRTPTISDGDADAPPVFVMRYKLWVERFHSDPTILNRTFLFNGVRRTLIGIMPPRFGWGNADIWIPRAISRVIADPQDQFRFYQLFGHLKRGLSRAQADAEISLLAKQISVVYPRDYPPNFRARVVLYARLLAGDYELMLYVMLGAVLFVLLIACGNVANLLLARSIAREKEFAIQVAMGASRFEIVRRLLLESLLLGCTGAMLGWGLAYLGLKFLLLVIPPPAVQPSAIISLDMRVMAFAIAATLFAVIAVGLGPALQSAGRDANAALRDGGRGVTGGFRRGRMRNALVVTEVALSLTLLACAGILMRSFLALQKMPLGLATDHILVLRPALPQARYKTAPAIMGFYRPLMERLRAVPGVTNVASFTALPLYGGISSDVAVPGTSPTEQWRAIVQLVNDDFFATMRMQFAQGRPFNQSELYGARKIAVINRAFASKYLGSSEPIGARFRLPNLAKWPDPVTEPTFEVIGVVVDAKNRGLQDAPDPELWIPYTVTGSFFRGLLIRTKQDPLLLTNVVRQEIWATDPTVASTINRTMDDFVNEISYSRPRFTLTILTIFAGLGLILAAIGVYGVMSYATQRQTHEIGIRMALGATEHSVLRYVIGRGLRLILIGVGIGLIGAIAGTRLLGSQLVGVTSYDPMTLGFVIFVLVATGIFATWLPARKATLIDPAIALRHD